MLTRCECRVKDVNVDRYVHIRRANSVLELLDYALYANAVDVPSSNDLEATAEVITKISFGSDEWCTNPRMYRRVTYQAFFVRKV